MDSRVDYNCIAEGLIPIQYYVKTYETLKTANIGRLRINYKLLITVK